jgi:pilus assembly protein CpaF
MSFFSDARSVERSPAPIAVRPAPAPREDDAAQFYRDLIERRPALLEEKLKLHARIIDDFNLALLEKLPQEEFVRQIQAYVAKYVRA